MKTSLIKTTVNKNENWVHKTLAKRQLYPFVLSIGFALLILVLYLGVAFSNYYELMKRQDEVVAMIEDYSAKSKKYDSALAANEATIKSILKSGVNQEELSLLVSRICDMLKANGALGGYYIIQDTNKKYLNVTDVEIQITYGDRELLYNTMSQALGEFYSLKSIEYTKLGIKCEVMKR